jgi:predicted RNA-binding Zn-ribbon protein involved in translation (DUF1610 family)
MVDGKTYLVLDPGSRLDASALYEYQEIVILARGGLAKSAEVCRAVSRIHDDLLLRLHFENVSAYTDPARVRANRGVMQLAKLTAMRIWLEGRQAADAFVCPACEFSGRVNLSMGRLFPCPGCGQHVDMRDAEENSR